MLRILRPLTPKKLPTKQVRCLLYPFSSAFFFTRPHFFTTTTSDTYPLLLPPTPSSTQTHLEISPTHFSSIAEAFILKCSHLFETRKGKSCSLCNSTSLKDLLLDVSQVVPALTRRFRRFSSLRPEDILELLLGFQYECERVAVRSGTVESLWGIFNWASHQDKNFRHLPKSCEVMSSVLLRYGMLREVQLLVLTVEKQGIMWDTGVIFSGLIEGYVDANDLERAVLAYDQMRERGLVPLMVCYCGLIDLLVKMNRTKLAYRISLDMVEMGVDFGDSAKVSIENAIRLICGDGMIQEARSLIRKVMDLGFEPSNIVLNDIASGYCEKKDFEDLLNFVVETKCLVNFPTGNKIIGSICGIAGVEKANLFRLELERLGFRPDEITFGILIGWSCRERNLRSSFIYLSEMLSRGLRPDMWSYDALIGAIFREGLWKHAQEFLDEMVDSGITPKFSTFRVLIAGYCKARQFDAVKLVVDEMVKRCFADFSTCQDPLSFGFTVLGLNPLSVKLKRDNSVGLWKTEFFDSLGNGFYLDTDVDRFEQVVDDILDDSFIPDFDLLVKKEWDVGNFKAAFLLIDEMVRWGQELSLPVFSALVKGCCASQDHFKQCSSLIEKMPKLSKLLDQEALNLLVQSNCKKGLVYKGRTFFDQMLQRNLTIMNDTYTALILGFCKKGNVQDLHYFWDIARCGKWFPKLKDFQYVVEFLCRRVMLKEAVELFKCMLTSDPHSWRETCHLFIEKLSSTGFTSIAHVLENEFLQQGFVLCDITYIHLIRGFCMERKHTVVSTLLDTVLAMNMVPCLDISLTSIPEQCKGDENVKDVNLKQVHLEEQSRFLVQNTLIKGFCVTRRVEEAAILFSYVSLKDAASLDVETYNILLEGYCKDENTRKVGELLTAMIRKHISVSISSYRNLLRLMCMEHRFTYALRLKDLMLRQCKSDSLIIYNILIFNLFFARNCLAVNEVLDELQEKGLDLNEATCNFLIHGFSVYGDASSCLHYLSTMISKGFRPSARSLRAVISILSDNRGFVKVLELSELMESRGWVHGSTVQNTIVGGLLSMGRLQEAEHFLDRIVNKGLISNTIDYNNLIKQFCWHGRLNKAVDLMNTMLNKGNIPDSISYDTMIQSFCAWNHLNQALDLQTEMLDRYMKPRINTWDMLVQKLCQHGRIAEAEKLLLSMVRVGEAPTRLMYSLVIDGYRYENNLSKASELMKMMQQSGYEPDFDMHWSIISKLSNLKDSNNNNNGSSQGFLSRLISGTGILHRDNCSSNKPR